MEDEAQGLAAVKRKVKKDDPFFLLPPPFFFGHSHSMSKFPGQGETPMSQH